MRVVVVGAGPTGLFTAMALARRGHRVTVVDRDTGPGQDGTWPRRGVMQFHHPHAFRAQVAEALQAELPEVWADLIAAGAEPVAVPRGPDGADAPEVLMAVRCRRSTFERVLRAAAEREPGVVLHTGHVDEVCAVHGRAAGVRADGMTLDADLVVAASGRAGRLGHDLRAPAQDGDCGVSYVSRQYRLLPGAEPGPMNFPLGQGDVYRGYQSIVFLHDNGVFSTAVVRASDDRALAALRLPEAYAAAVRAIPALAAWTDPDRAVPYTPVLPGGRLHNTYQGQLDDSGAVALPGLLFVGDAVCTTNPAVGRGTTTSLLQAQELLRLIDEGPSDLVGLTLAFDAWCTDNIAPWFEDHVYWDAEQARRWAGADVDLTRRLPSDLVVAATEADPSLFPLIGPYLGMRALPSSLDAARPRVDAIYASGWRPSVPDGPTRDELADLVTAHAGAS